jgi:hypothetical protein
LSESKSGDLPDGPIKELSIGVSDTTPTLPSFRQNITPPSQITVCLESKCVVSEIISQMEGSEGIERWWQLKDLQAVLNLAKPLFENWPTDVRVLKKLRVVEARTAQGPIWRRGEPLSADWYPPKPKPTLLQQAQGFWIALTDLVKEKIDSQP